MSYPHVPSLCPHVGIVEPTFALIFRVWVRKSKVHKFTTKPTYETIEPTFALNFCILGLDTKIELPTFSFLWVRLTQLGINQCETKDYPQPTNYPHFTHMWVDPYIPTFAPFYIVEGAMCG